MQAARAAPRLLVPAVCRRVPFAAEVMIRYTSVLTFRIALHTVYMQTRVWRYVQLISAVNTTPTAWSHGSSRAARYGSTGAVLLSDN